MASLAVPKLIIDEEFEVCREEDKTRICGTGVLVITVRTERNGIGG